ncbi:MAG: STAS domain-containing protein [Cellvibrio sp.]|uniref:STAS domain-containing protein n=1 Tax=Cellvibrio sp. TaxID=1965322 RepID=UPI0031A9784D
MAHVAVIRMPRRFDYSGGAEFNRKVSAALDTPGVINLDCVDLEYIDSAGIGLLVMSQKKAQSCDSKIVMTNLKVSPKEILHLANLQKVIELA